MIRKIDENGVITTIIGSNGLTSTQPLSCDSGMDITQVDTSFLCVVTLIHTVEITFLYQDCISNMLDESGNSEWHSMDEFFHSHDYFKVYKCKTTLDFFS